MRRLAAALAVCLALAVPASASADPYVALGDSVAAGAGASTMASRYVNRLYADYQSSVGADELLNHAQGGATSTTLRGGQLATAIADIDAADDAKAVTIDIGGNDALSGQCETNWDDPATCPFRANLAFILNELQGALDADPGSETFIVMAYYNPAVGEGNEAPYDQGLLGSNLAIGCADTGADVGLNDVIYQEAGRLNLPVADPYDAFKAGGQSFMADSVHPNDAGHLAVANAFRSAAPSPCTGPLGPDTTPPETTFTKKPQDVLLRPRAKFRFIASETYSTFECRVDRGKWRACGPLVRLRHLEVGRHKFRVRATDPAGNVEKSPARDRFRVKPRRHAS